MFRKLLVAAVAAFTLGAASLAATAPAEARGPFYNLPRGGWHGGGGGWRGGGGGWGGRHWGGGGWGGRRWYGGGYGRRWHGGGWGWGGGLALAPLLLTPGLYGNDYYDDGYYDYGPVCRWRRVRIHTYYGWRIGRQRICY